MTVSTKVRRELERKLEELSEALSRIDMSRVMEGIREDRRR